METTLTDELQREDIAIERAAMALCWDARPGIFAGSPHDDDRLTWWQLQTETDRRLYLRRARVAITEWERAHA